jgi:dipeptide/tripeptide permease
MQIDPRGPRFSAALSAIVLGAVLVTGSVWLFAWQAAVFAVAAGLGLKYSPYGLIYRWLIRPRLGPPQEMEDPAGPRFSQGVGLFVSVIGIIGYATGLTALGMAGAALAFAAAFLNAAFGLCLGCEMYVLIRRIWPGQRGVSPAAPDREVAI